VAYERSQAIFFAGQCLQFMVSVATHVTSTVMHDDEADGQLGSLSPSSPAGSLSVIASGHDLQLHGSSCRMACAVKLPWGQPYHATLASQGRGDGFIQKPHHKRSHLQCITQTVKACFSSLCYRHATHYMYALWNVHTTALCKQSYHTPGMVRHVSQNGPLTIIWAQFQQCTVFTVFLATVSLV
jgi:hypothetical protein